MPTPTFFEPLPMDKKKQLEMEKQIQAALSELAERLPVIDKEIEVFQKNCSILEHNLNLVKQINDNIEDNMAAIRQKVSELQKVFKEENLNNNPSKEEIIIYMEDKIKALKKQCEELEKEKIQINTLFPTTCTR